MATLVNEAMFGLTLRGHPATRAEVLPGWGPSGRLGVLVREPFGALGASLLIQLAVTAFYDAVPSRREAAPQYPEIYLFHLGGRFGDHRPFDFWPPRKEVFLKGEPLEVLEALNDRAITVLALPEVAIGHGPTAEADGRLDASGAPWSEANSFRERTTAAYVYSADGKAANGNLRIQGLDGVLEQNGQRAASPERSLEWFQGLRPEELPTALPGPGTLAQTRFWARTLTDRFHEVDARTRSLVRERAAARLAAGKPTETYRRLEPGEALQLL
ncbi:hypothetical protein [Arthrobacter ginkgonis]